MMANEYQYLAHKTAIFPRVFVSEKGHDDLINDFKDLNECGILYPALGLAGEAGEFANKVKKVLRDNHGKMTPEKAQELADELGDIAWYLAECATDLNKLLADILRSNLKKLASRAERGTLTGSGDVR